MAGRDRRPVGATRPVARVPTHLGDLGATIRSPLLVGVLVHHFVLNLVSEIGDQAPQQVLHALGHVVAMFAVTSHAGLAVSPDGTVRLVTRAILHDPAGVCSDIN